MFHMGNPVIYRITKNTTHPGPRAKNIAPAPKGDFYKYEVDKFWVVAKVLDEGVLLRTRRGKEHIVKPDDPKLRRAHWWERWSHQRRFPNSDD